MHETFKHSSKKNYEPSTELYNLVLATTLWYYLLRLFSRSENEDTSQ